MRVTVETLEPVVLERGGVVAKVRLATEVSIPAASETLVEARFDWTADGSPETRSVIKLGHLFFSAPVAIESGSRFDLGRRLFGDMVDRHASSMIETEADADLWVAEVHARASVMRRLDGYVWTQCEIPMLRLYQNAKGWAITLSTELDGLDKLQNFHFGVSELEDAEDFMRTLADEDGRDTFSGKLEISGTPNGVVSGNIYDAYYIEQYMSGEVMALFNTSVNRARRSVRSEPPRTLPAEALLTVAGRGSSTPRKRSWGDRWDFQAIERRTDMDAAKLVARAATLSAALTGQIGHPFPLYGKQFVRHLRRWDRWALKTGFSFSPSGVTMEELARPGQVPGAGGNGPEVVDVDRGDTLIGKDGVPTVFLR